MDSATPRTPAAACCTYAVGANGRTEEHMAIFRLMRAQAGGDAAAETARAARPVMPAIIAGDWPRLSPLRAGVNLFRCEPV